jgi:hypothetical protein
VPTNKLQEIAFATKSFAHADIDMDLSYDFFRNYNLMEEKTKADKKTVEDILEKYAKKGEDGDYVIDPKTNDFVAKDPKKQTELEDILKKHGEMEIELKVIPIAMSRLPKIIPNGLTNLQGKTVQVNYNTLRPILYDIILVKDDVS